MKIRIKTLFAGLCPLIALIASAAAQQFGPADLRTISWQDVDPGRVGRGFATDLDADGYLDLVYGDGFSLGACMNPAFRKGTQAKITNELIRSASPTPDGKLVTVGNSLKIWDYTPETASGPNGSHFTGSDVEADPSASWSGSRIVHVADFSGGVGVIGLTSDRMTVLKRDDLGGNTPTLQETLPYAVLDVVPYRYDSNGDRAVAITTHEIYLVDWSGPPQLVVTLPVPAVKAVATTFEDTEASHDRIAMLLTAAGTADTTLLYVWDHTEGLELGQSLVGDGAYGLAAGKIDGDDDEDLVVSIRNGVGDLRPVLYTNQIEFHDPQGAEPRLTFDNDHRDLVDLGLVQTVDPLQSAFPVVADFARDDAKEQDLAIFSKAEGDVVVALNQTVDHRTKTFTIPPATGSFPEYSLILDNDTPRIFGGLPIDASADPDADGVEILAWRAYEKNPASQPWTSSPLELELDSVGLDAYSATLDAPGQINILGYGLTLDEEWPEDDDVLILEIIPYEDLGAGAIRRGPISVYSCVWNGDADTAIDSYLANPFANLNVGTSFTEESRDDIDGLSPLDPLPGPSGDDDAPLAKGPGGV